MGGTGTWLKHSSFPDMLNEAQLQILADSMNIPRADSANEQTARAECAIVAIKRIKEKL